MIYSMRSRRFSSRLVKTLTRRGLPCVPCPGNWGDPLPPSYYGLLPDTGAFFRPIELCRNLLDGTELGRGKRREEANRNSGTRRKTHRCATAPFLLKADRLRPSGPQMARYLNDGITAYRKPRINSVQILRVGNYTDSRTECLRSQSAPSLKSGRGLFLAVVQPECLQSQEEQ